MARDVRAGNDKAAAGADIKTVIPVGEAWTRAIQAGLADPNPYDGIEAGKLNLWTYDSYHASSAGYYLEAMVVFGSLTGATRGRSVKTSAQATNWDWIGRRSQRSSRSPSINSRPGEPSRRLH